MEDLIETLDKYLVENGRIVDGACNPAEAFRERVGRSRRQIDGGYLVNRGIVEQRIEQSSANKSGRAGNERFQADAPSVWSTPPDGHLLLASRRESTDTISAR